MFPLKHPHYKFVSEIRLIYQHALLNYKNNIKKIWKYSYTSSLNFSYLEAQSRLQPDREFIHAYRYCPPWNAIAFLKRDFDRSNYRSSHQMCSVRKVFYREFSEISKNTFFTKHLWATGSVTTENNGQRLIYHYMTLLILYTT